MFMPTQSKYSKILYGGDMQLVSNMLLPNLAR